MFYIYTYLILFYIQDSNADIVEDFWDTYSYKYHIQHNYKVFQAL